MGCVRRSTHSGDQSVGRAMWRSARAENEYKNCLFALWKYRSKCLLHSPKHESSFGRRVYFFVNYCLLLLHASVPYLMWI